MPEQTNGTSTSSEPARPVDVLVAGAGIGGLCTAARLTAAGCRVGIVERLRHVGGRFSTRVIDGFKLPTGAFMVASDDPLKWTFDELGLTFPVREATERPAYLIAGEIVEIGARGGLRTIVAAAARHDGSDVERILAAVRAAMEAPPGANGTALDEWLRANGAGPVVCDVFNANTRAYLAVNCNEVTVDGFAGYLRTASGGSRYGIPPDGAQAIVGALADYVLAGGGTIEFGTTVQQLLVDGGRVTGAVLNDGRVRQADLVVSNLGLPATAALLDEPWRGLVPAEPEGRNAPGVACFVASREPFFEHLSVTIAGSRGVCIVTTPTLLCPELAPEGWHFMESLSTFADSTVQDDPKAEIARHHADLDDLVPGWRERGRLLQTATYRGGWPVARTWAGYDPAERFPLPGLALVGDAVKGPGWTGVGASADGARLLVESALAGAA